MVPSRRHFIRSAATGIGTLAASRVLGANDRIRMGIIGIGDRGTQIAREAIACPNTDFVAFADIYTRRLEDAKKLAPNAKTYLDYRHLLEDKTIDAVLIATPQHLHCECFVAAMQAGKHVYQEKTMAFTVDHAKRMRAAYKAAGNRTVQIGHQWCSSGPGDRRRQFPEAASDGQDHRDPRPHVPQHAARQAAVVAARLSRHDARKHHLEIVPGRSGAARFRSPTATSTGASSGIIRAATSMRTCATRSPSGTK